MKLEVLFETPTLKGMRQRLNIHFDQEMKVHGEALSMFESYQVRFTKKFIPEIWKYRIVCKDGVYRFGKIIEEK